MKSNKILTQVGDVVLLKRDSELNQCPIAITEYVMSDSNGIFRSVKLGIENSDHPFFPNQGWSKSDFQKTGKKMVFLLVKEMLVDFAKKEPDSRQLYYFTGVSNRCQR